MFRKIHSDRDPRDTVFTELKREFNPYLEKARGHLRSALTGHPKTVFVLMVVAIIASTILSFALFKQRDAVKYVKNHIQIITPVTGGMDQIMQTGRAISEMMQLKKSIDSLSAKKQLNARDSLTLERALDRFQQLNKLIFRGC